MLIVLEWVRSVPGGGEVGPSCVQVKRKIILGPDVKVAPGGSAVSGGSAVAVGSAPLTRRATSSSTFFSAWSVQRLRVMLAPAGDGTRRSQHL